MAERNVYLQSIYDGGYINPANNIPDSDVFWLNASNCVPVDKDYFSPTPTIREWFYLFNTKRKFICFGIPEPPDVPTVAWEIAVPRLWNKRYVYFTPYWTYKYGLQGGDNPDQPAYIGGNFQWEIVTVIFPAAENPPQSYLSASWDKDLVWSVPSVDVQDKIYCGTTKSIQPTNIENINDDTNILLVQLWRDDIIARAVDVAGIRVEFLHSPLEA